MIVFTQCQEFKKETNRLQSYENLACVRFLPLSPPPPPPRATRGMTTAATPIPTYGDFDRNLVALMAEEKGFFISLMALMAEEKGFFISIKTV